MTTAHAVRDLPRPSEITAPLTLIQNYEPVAHPNLSALSSRARRVIKQLQGLAEFKLKVNWNIASDASEEDERRAQLHELLASLRYAEENLCGYSARRFKSEVRKHLSVYRLHTELETALADAIENVREMRAAVAIFSDGEDYDDLQLGKTLLPKVKDPKPGESSVEYKW